MIKIELQIQFEDIKEHKYSIEKVLTILFKNGDILTLNGEKAKQVNKKLCRNFSGEHLY